MGNTYFLKSKRFEKREKEIIANMLSNSDLSSEDLSYIIDRVIPAIYDLDRLARSNKALFQALRVGVLICGVLIPTLAGRPFLEEYISTIIILLSLLSTVSVGILVSFRNQQIWKHHRITFELLRSELYLFIRLAGPYLNDNNSHKQSIKIFIKNIEGSFKKEVTDYFRNLSSFDASQPES